MTSIPARRFSTRLLTCKALLGIVVVGLVVGLVTRFCDVTVPANTPAVFHATSAVSHQHLDRDAFEWTPTASDFSIFVSFVCARHTPPAAEPLLVVHLDDSLANRPPPAFV